MRHYEATHFITNRNTTLEGLINIPPLSNTAALPNACLGEERQYMTIGLGWDAKQNSRRKLRLLPSSRQILGITVRWHGVTFRKTFPQIHPTRTAAYPCRRNGWPSSTGSVTDRPVRGNELHVYTVVNSRFWVSFCVVWTEHAAVYFSVLFSCLLIVFGAPWQCSASVGPFQSNWGWSRAKQTRNSNQNKHATQTKTIPNRTAAKLIFFLFPTMPMSNSSQQLAPWYGIFPDTSKRNSLFYGCSKTTNAFVHIFSLGESCTFSKYNFISKQFSILQY